ncbi:MAG: bifunctional DNA primase/polymerase, partial [Candidatus Hadarchaeales archaeon]
GPYKPGDTADLPDGWAQVLIGRGVVRRIEAENGPSPHTGGAGTDPEQFRLFLSLLPGEIRPKVWYFPVQPGNKRPDVPSGESWKDPKFRLTEEQALRRLEEGGNVGVVGLPGSLAIIDIDRDNVQRAYPLLPERLKGTLTVRTRSNGLHLYYLNNGVPNVDLGVQDVRDFLPKVDFPCPRCGASLPYDAAACECGASWGKLMEIRSDSRYVLAPGCFVPHDGGDGPYKAGVRPNLESFHGVETFPDGLYKVVVRLPPIPIGPDDLPWLKARGKGGGRPPEELELRGEYMGLPCVKMLFKTPLMFGRRIHGEKLLAIAWVLDHGGDLSGLEPIARAYRDFQDTDPEHPMPSYRETLAWARTAIRHGYTWSCSEMAKLWRESGVLPPCRACPAKGGFMEGLEGA